MRIIFFDSFVIKTTSGERPAGSVPVKRFLRTGVFIEGCKYSPTECRSRVVEVSRNVYGRGRVICAKAGIQTDLKGINYVPRCGYPPITSK